jgi:hypothetical protein
VIFNHALNFQLRREFPPHALNGGTVIFFFRLTLSSQSLLLQPVSDLVLDYMHYGMVTKSRISFLRSCPHHNHHALLQPLLLMTYPAQPSLADTSS